MIKTFADKETLAAFHGLHTRRLPATIRSVAKRKLDQVHAAKTLDFLRSPPGNRLEALKGDRVNQYSIRINEQWRICFRFEDGDAYDVEIVDYH